MQTYLSDLVQSIDIPFSKIKDQSPKEDAWIPERNHYLFKSVTLQKEVKPFLDPSHYRQMTEEEKLFVKPLNEQQHSNTDEN